MTPRKPSPKASKSKGSAKRKAGGGLCLSPLPLDLPCTRPAGHSGDHNFSRARYENAVKP